MPQMIDLKNIGLKKHTKCQTDRNIPQEELHHKVQHDLENTINMLLKINPGKINYTINETAITLNMGYEFVRRRLQRGKIKCVYFGDRQMVTIDEVARLINHGV